MRDVKHLWFPAVLQLASDKQAFLKVPGVAFNKGRFSNDVILHIDDR